MMERLMIRLFNDSDKPTGLILLDHADVDDYAELLEAKERLARVEQLEAERLALRLVPHSSACLVCRHFTG